MTCRLDTHMASIGRRNSADFVGQSSRRRWLSQTTTIRWADTGIKRALALCPAVYWHSDHFPYTIPSVYAVTQRDPSRRIGIHWPSAQRPRLDRWSVCQRDGSGPQRGVPLTDRPVLWTDQERTRATQDKAMEGYRGPVCCLVRRRCPLQPAGDSPGDRTNS